MAIAMGAGVRPWKVLNRICWNLLHRYRILGGMMPEVQLPDEVGVNMGP
jgi:hypothetical protein